MNVRCPAVAGRFYPGDAVQCARQMEEFFAAARVELGGPPDGPQGIGGVVPHAGWVCSAAIACATLLSLRRQPQPDVVVIFAAVHTPLQLHRAALDTFGRWHLPGDAASIATEFRDRLCDDARHFLVDDRFHLNEHAVEVELPLIRRVWPDAEVLPVEVPPVATAGAIGRRVAETVASEGLHAVYLASSDLTHYGPDYQFYPAGIGPHALVWAMDNDRRLLDRVLAMDVDGIVPTAARDRSACGAGAIAAMMEACVCSGAREAKVLRHSNSWNVLHDRYKLPPDNAVGYAAVVLT